MLRCYDLSNAVNRQLLERVLTKLKALKGEFNVLDMSISLVSTSSMGLRAVGLKSWRKRAMIC